MQIGHVRILLVVEPFCHKDALVTREGNRLWKDGLVHVVGRSPGRVHPMCTGFENVVLEVMLEVEEFAQGCCLFGKPVQTVVVPGVVLCEVVARKPVPRFSLARVGPRLFPEGCPHGGIASSDALVVVTSPVVPQAVVLVPGQDVFVFHPCHHAVDAVGQSCALTVGHKACQGMFARIAVEVRSAQFSVPPGCLISSQQDLSLLCQSSVADFDFFGVLGVLGILGVLGVLRILRNLSPSFHQRHRWCFLNPLPQRMSRHISCLHRHLHRLCNTGAARSIGRTHQDARIDHHLLPQSFLQLCIVEAAGLHVVVAVRPVSVARELCPGSVGAIGVDGVGAVTMDFGG